MLMNGLYLQVDRMESIHIIDYKTGDTIIKLSRHSQMGYDEMEFNTERNRLLTVACDKIVRIWNFQRGNRLLQKRIFFKYKGGCTSTKSLVVD